MRRHEWILAYVAFSRAIDSRVIYRGLFFATDKASRVLVHVHCCAFHERAEIIDTQVSVIKSHIGALFPHSLTAK